MLEKVKTAIVNNKKKVVAGVAVAGAAVATAVVGGIALAKGGSDDFIDVVGDAAESVSDVVVDAVEEVVE